MHSLVSSARRGQTFGCFPTIQRISSPVWCLVETIVPFLELVEGIGMVEYIKWFEPS